MEDPILYWFLGSLGIVLYSMYHAHIEDWAGQRAGICGERKGEENKTILDDNKPVHGFTDWHLAHITQSISFLSMKEKNTP